MSETTEVGERRGPCWRGECRTACYYPDGCTEPHAGAALRARVLAVLPSECWVTRSDSTLRCTAMIGGGFENGAKWTEEMCCVPCRVRAALA